MKQILLKDKFESLEKNGKIGKFIEKQHEEFDKKRARRWILINHF